MLLDLVVLTPEEVATALKVDQGLIYDLIKKGDINAVSIGPHLRITKEELSKFLGTSSNINNSNTSKHERKKSLTTPDIITIIRDNVTRNVFVDVREIHDLVYKVAMSKGLMNEHDFQPEHISKGKSPRWRHLVNASLQRIKNTNDNRLGITIAEHVNKKYKFI